MPMSLGDVHGVGVLRSEEATEIARLKPLPRAS